MCSTVKFDTGVKPIKAAAMPQLDDLQLTDQYSKQWIWYKAKEFARKLIGQDDVTTLAAATQEE